MPIDSQLEVSVGLTRAILDHTRHYLARELLRNTGLTLNDIAMQLGFAEPSAFFRAFRKWQGCTPGQYRAA